MNETGPERTGDWQMSAEGKLHVILEEMLDRQENHWRRGERVLVEQLVADNSDGGSREVLLELIVNEALLREERGDKASLSDYQNRFPELADALRIQWEVDRALFSRLSSRHSRQPGSGPAWTPGTDKTGANSTGMQVKIRPFAPHLPKSAPEPTPDTPPGYEITGELGRGGMGVVYAATNLLLKRPVALKMLLASRQDTQHLIRFLIEAEAMAQVRHPNVVQVYEAGEHGGHPFLALEYLSGDTLSARLLKGRPPIREGLRLMLKIARGVEAAHRQGIVHRDLKPGNVMFDAGGEPKVADFGLAKHGAKDLTATDAMMGTPAYMAPEQAKGETKTAGPPADVYALGVMLYEMTTGKRPFVADKTAALIHKVINEAPESPRRREPSIPRDVEVITLKCLEKDPQARYADAGLMADDLERFLAYEPILARPVGPLARAWRWCRRNRVVASLLALTIIVLTAGVVSTSLMWMRAQRNFETAEENFQETFRAVDESFTLISENKLLAQPGMADLRYDLLSATRPFLERFVEKRQNDPKVRRELVKALTRLGDLSAHTKSTEAAIRQYDEAARLADEQVRENPDDVEQIRLAAYARVKHAALVARMNQHEAADRLLTEALRLFEQLRGKDPGNLRDAADLADCRLRQANARESIQPPADVLPLYQSAIAEYRELYDRQNPPTPEMKTQYARMRLAYGQFLTTFAGRPAEAVPELESAKNLLTELMGVRDQQFYARQELTLVNSLLAELYAERGTPADKARAKECLASATREAERLIAQFPTDIKIRTDLGTHLLKASLLHSEWGEHDTAKKQAGEALGHFQKLRQDQPGNPKFRLMSCQAFDRLADICDTQSELPKAPKTALLEESVRHLTGAIEAINPPEQFGITPVALAEMLIHRGRILRVLKQYPRAIADFDALMQLAPPGSPPWKDAEQEKAMAVQAMKK